MKLNLDKAQARMKLQVDKKRKDIIFAEGDLVLVKLQPYRQSSVATRMHHKLCQKIYYGPYRICKKISNVAYTLELPEERKINPTFHL